MRLASGIVLALVLTACDGATQPDDLSAEPAVSAEKIEAERACAELTGYSPDAPAAAVSETQAMRAKEFKACVTAVAGGGHIELRGRSTDPVSAPAPSDP